MATDRDRLIDLIDRTYQESIDARPIRQPYPAIADALLAAGWAPASSSIRYRDEQLADDDSYTNVEKAQAEQASSAITGHMSRPSRRHA